jgi:hypothetical protein
MRHPGLMPSLGTTLWSAEASKRAKMKMKFPTPNYRGLEPRPICAGGREFPLRACLPGAARWLRSRQTVSGLRRAHPVAERCCLHNVGTSGGGGSRLSGLVCDRDWSGRRAEIAAPTARRAGRPCDHRYHAVRYGQGTIQRWKKMLLQIMNWDRFNVKNHMTIDDA